VHLRRFEQTGWRVGASGNSDVSAETQQFGKWGPGPMPSQPQINEADLEKLARWILAR
jgi:hypothetical protein